MALDYKIIGERLQKARIAKGYTQEYLAEQLEVSVAFLSRIERGSIKLNLKRLNQLCSLLDLEEGYILNGTSEGSKNYLNTEFNTLLENCPPDKLKVIYDVAKVIIKNK